MPHPRPSRCAARGYPGGSCGTTPGGGAWKEPAGGALDPDEVAAAVAYAYGRPRNVTVREIVLASTGQEA
ncbi:MULTISPECIES: hypothetical protein [unclassified Streptomyces]|uniref:hypothetical protein n=1 Tax=unclassified Streptomyces TaxID=2593676 RepID=UPI0035E36B2D